MGYHSWFLRQRGGSLSNHHAADRLQHDLLPHGPLDWLRVVLDRAGQGPGSDPNRLRSGSPVDWTDVSRQQNSSIRQHASVLVSLVANDRNTASSPSSSCECVTV